MSDPDGTKGQTLEELIERYESGQPARDGLEQAEYDHLAACADEPEQETRAETEAEAAAADHFLHELREAGARTDQARLSGDASRIASAQQAEWDLAQAAIDEAAGGRPVTSQETGPEDPEAAGDWTPDTSRALPVEIGSAIGDALPWLEAREREARAASDAEARGGRGPSASYAEWAAVGTAGTPAGPQPDGPETGT